MNTNKDIIKIAEVVFNLVDVLDANNTMIVVRKSPEIFHNFVSENTSRKDITPLVQELLKIRKIVGKKDALNLINMEYKHRELKKILRKAPSLKETQKAYLPNILKWTKDNAFDYLKQLNLSEFQKDILRALVSSGKPVSLNYIKSYFENNNNYIENGSRIGGSLAGLTKKCQNHMIPLIVHKNLNKNKDIVYKISPTLLPYLKEFLKK